MALSTGEKLRRLGGVFATAMERFVRTVVGLPVAAIAVTAGAVVFGVGAVVAAVDEDRGSSVRMRGLNTMSWGMDWIPFEVDVEWDD